MLILFWTKPQVIFARKKKGFFLFFFFGPFYNAIFCPMIFHEFLFCIYIGSGLASKNKYFYGFFNAQMKLPPGFTSGIVIAFYVSFFPRFLNYIYNLFLRLSEQNLVSYFTLCLYEGPKTSIFTLKYELT